MTLLGQTDITEKVLADYNDVFSDIFNVLVFNGEQRIAEEDLENSSVISQYKADDSAIHEEERDVLKYWKSNGVRLAVLGLENQTYPEHWMPFRVIGYDGANYRSQLLSRPKEFLPVVTIVLYFGTEHRWNRPTHLKELLKIPSGLEEYVNDYEIHVFNIAWLEEEQIKKFKSDFRIVAEFFRDKRLGNLDIQNDKTLIKHVDEILKLLTVLTRDESYVQITGSGKEIHNMCEFVQTIRQQGIQQGMQQGRLAVAASMLQDGMVPEKVAKYSGLPMSLILQLMKG